MDDEITADNEQIGEAIVNQKMPKEFLEKFVKMAMELKELKQSSNSRIRELELENKLLQAELREQKMVTERNDLLTKIAKMEGEQKRQKEEEAETKKEKWQKALTDQIKQLQNAQKKEISELEQKQTAQFEQLKSQFNEQVLTVQKELVAKIAKTERKEEKGENKWKNEFCAKIGQLKRRQSDNWEQTKKTNGALQAKIDEKLIKAEFKEQKLVTVQKELSTKIAKMEQKQKEQQKGGEEREKRQKVYADQMKQLQNDQAQINKLVGQLKLFQQQNWWDANACHADLEITGTKRLVVHYKANGQDYRSAFTKNSISRSGSSIFYFEMQVEKNGHVVAIGLATKEMPLDEYVGWHKDSWGYYSNGTFWVNNSKKCEQIPSFSAGDVVGCGVNFTNRRIFCTKNGQRLANIDDLVIPQSLPIDSLFPCVTLWDSGDKIVANFCPPFKFDIGTL